MRHEYRPTPKPIIGVSWPKMRVTPNAVVNDVAGQRVQPRKFLGDHLDRGLRADSDLTRARTVTCGTRGR